MGAKHSSSPALSLATATEDQATALPVDRFHRYSLNFPRLVLGRRQCQGSHRKMKSKRNVSATFTVNEFEIPYDSQESNPQSCISSMSSTQNVFSSASSVSNGSPAVVAAAASAATASSDSNRLCSFVGGEFNRENLLLNINSATEEGLMTLPGVTRQTARNIVSYRKLIGGFKNIQDIALVSGVGASLYVRFKSDITCYGLTSDLQDHHQQQQQRLTSSVASERRSKSSTLSKHSSTSSSGIDIATINEDDDNNDCNKIAHQRNHHHHHHHHNNNNNNNNNNKASTVYENHVIVNSDTNNGLRFQ